MRRNEEEFTVVLKGDWKVTVRLYTNEDQIDEASEDLKERIEGAIEQAIMQIVLSPKDDECHERILPWENN